MAKEIIKKPRLLIVDDSELVCKSLVGQLRYFDIKFDIKTSGSAEDALAIVETFHPDFVLTDVILPGMDGYDLTKQILKLYPLTYVLLISGEIVLKEHTDKVLEAGAVDYLLKPVRDIDLYFRLKTLYERRNIWLHAIRKLNKNKKEQQVLLNNITNGVLIVDRDMNILTCNAKATTYYPDIKTGDKAQFLDASESLSQSDDLVSSPISQTIIDGKVYEKTFKIKIKKESKIIHLVSSPIMASENKVGAAIILLEDMTENAKLDQHLKSMQNLETIGLIASGIAHDFNDKLASIMGYAELLETEFTPPSKEHAYVKSILDTAEDAAELSRKFSTVVRKINPESTKIDVNELIDEVSFLLNRTLDKRIKLSTKVLVKNALIIANKTQIQNALINLGIYASEAISGIGKIEYSVRISMLEEDYCENLKIMPGAYLQIKISYNAHISDYEKNLLLQGNISSRENNLTGLGMICVRDTVTSLDGHMEVINKDDGSSCFNLFLPFVTKAIDDYEQAPQMNNTTIKGKGHILVVDDESSIREILRLMLEKFGYTVELAVDGKEALDIYENKWDEFGLIILDIDMPGLNGIDAYQCMKSVNNDINALFSTGFVHDQRVIDKLNVPVILKPFTKAQLSAIVKKLINPL